MRSSCCLCILLNQLLIPDSINMTPDMYTTATESISVAYLKNASLQVVHLMYVPYYSQATAQYNHSHGKEYVQYQKNCWMYHLLYNASCIEGGECGSICVSRVSVHARLPEPTRSKPRITVLQDWTQLCIPLSLLGICSVNTLHGNEEWLETMLCKQFTSYQMKEGDYFLPGLRVLLLCCTLSFTEVLFLIHFSLG